MSITAVSLNLAAAPRERAPVMTIEAAPRVAAAAPHGERRHDLVDALKGVLASDGERGRDEQAVARFTHALMQDLRSLVGAAEHDARGAASAPAHAWGRRAWSDLPQRIDALATATLPPREVPPQPNPLTTTTAAVHLMRVPSSYLLEAFAALRQAVGNQDSAPAPASRSELANFLERLAHELKPDAPAGLPAGSVVNLTA